MKIELYGTGTNRVSRPVWTLHELGLPYEQAMGREAIGDAAYMNTVQPLGRIPAVKIDGRPLFESAAICTWLADANPDKNLIAPTGTWERAMHEQWCSFALTEMECYLWSTVRNTILERLPVEMRVPQVAAQNELAFTTAAKALDTALEGKQFLVGEAFSVTDIIVAFTANWGRRMKLTGDCPNIERWLDGLYEREHCTLAKPEA